MGINPFKDKKVIIMGLGLLGGALNDAVFLAKNGAELTVTDLKAEEELKDSIFKLKKIKTDIPIKYHFGGHRVEDFQNADFILQPGNVPLDSPFLVEARKNNIPVYVSESLFALYSEATLVGITGTRGKSTTAHMVYECLKQFPPKGSKIFLGGNVKDVSTLALLEEVRKGDIVVLELDSWALHGMGEINTSPDIAIFTTFFDDHLNYYKGDQKTSRTLDQARSLYLEDKANIFKFQKTNNFLILGEHVEKVVVEKYGKVIKSRIIVARSINLPENLNLRVIGEHNRYNASCAFETLKLLGLTEKEIKKVLESFKGVAGRLEFVKEVNGIKIYNDTTATTPDATLAALQALGKDKNIVLIMGGADKGLDMSELVLEIPKCCKKVILLPGTGTDGLMSNFKFPISNNKVKNLNEAINLSMSEAQKGDVILFSPAFASFGMFKNEFDRGEKFLREMKGF